MPERKKEEKLSACPANRKKGRNLSEVGEFGLLGKINSWVAPPGDKGVTGIGDDCAVIGLPGGVCQLWTVDLLVAGRHFKAGEKPDLVGWKSLAVSLSDIAAMGGTPLYALVFIGLPGETTLDYTREIYRGMNRLAALFDVRIIGGDTVKSEHPVIGTTVIGETAREHLVCRDGAKPGDIVCLTGPLGDGPRKHLSFMPRVKEGIRIARELSPTAMIDISDGLVGDLGRITERSGVGAFLSLDSIPLVPGVTVEQALYSGEEFELLFTVSPEKKNEIARRGFHAAGEITRPGKGIRLVRSDGSACKPADGGYDHFS